MSAEVSDLIAKRFIARKDVKAIQHADGSWSPHTDDGKRTGNRLPWCRSDLESHLNGEKTFGHYLLNQDDQCKLFAFDIDLEKNAEPDQIRPYQGHWMDDEGYPIPFDARKCWQDRSHPSRNWSKYQLKMLASKLMAKITSDLETPCAAAYSGGKGVHVYGFTGLISASDARDGAQIVLDSLGGWKATRGTNFFKSEDTDPNTGYPNLSIEVFPKQGSLEGKDLGNLMRLVLGRNLRSKDPTFFIDMTSPMGQMVPIDPIIALTASSPWKSLT